MRTALRASCICSAAAAPDARACARAQWAQSGRFQLYDYGSGATNRAHYGAAAPLDVAGNYRLLDFPVDIMAGAPRLPRLLLRSRSTTG